MPSPWLSRWPQQKDGAGLGQLNRPLDRAGFRTQFLSDTPRGDRDRCAACRALKTSNPTRYQVVKDPCRGPIIEVRARLHLALGRAEEAWHDSSQAMQLLESHSWLPMPQTHLHTHFLALRALDRKEEALDHLRRARDRVMFVADKLADERLRQSWLQNVRMNREILEDWSEIHPLGSGTGKLA